MSHDEGSLRAAFRRAQRSSGSCKPSRVRSTASLVLPARRSPPANNARVVTPALRRFFASGVSPPDRARGTTGETRCKPPGAYLLDDKLYQKIQILAGEIRAGSREWSCAGALAHSLRFSASA